MYNVIRVEKVKNYTIISNVHLLDEKLSLKAKGLMTLLLALPNDEWELSINGLAKLSKDQRDSVASTLTELESSGYLVKKQRFDANNRFNGYEYTLYEHPCADSPYTEFPFTEKPQQLNTNILNTNLDHKDINNNINTNIYFNDKKLDEFNNLNTKPNKVLNKEDISRVIEAWNTSGGLTIKKLNLNSKRGKMLTARIAEYGIDEVLNAIDEYKHSSFLRGETGFVADFEWFVKPNNFVKVWEGKYRDKAKATSTKFDKGKQQIDYFMQQALGGTE